MLALFRARNDAVVSHALPCVQAARAEEGVAAAAKLKRQGEELKGLRDQLEAAQVVAAGARVPL
eukprot:1291708-Pleurochrysis_carterae.AAC.1